MKHLQTGHILHLERFVSLLRSIKLLPCQGEVAPSAGTEGFFTIICAMLLHNAQARQRTLPSRFLLRSSSYGGQVAIHLPLVGKELFTTNFTTIFKTSKEHT